jgi:transcriptional regulator with XRE-family HTH domain
MKSIGNTILEIRKSKELTQEELAELSKVNLRTIQRIENNESEPRGKTLNLICEVLQIDSSRFNFKSNQYKGKKIGQLITGGFFLFLLNSLLTGVIAFMTIARTANWNSRLGALLLSFFIPIFIVHFTKKMDSLERMLKFGIGFLFYATLLFIVQGFQNGLHAGFSTSLFPCMIISLLVFYYGKNIFKLLN